MKNVGVMDLCPPNRISFLFLAPLGDVPPLVGESEIEIRASRSWYS